MTRYRLPIPTPVDETGARFGEPAPAPPSEPQFSLAVVNKTDLAIVAVRVDGGPWVRLRAPVQRTCAASDDTCVSGESWSPLVSLPATGAHDIELELVDRSGKRFRSELRGYSPLSGFRSGIVFLGA